MVQRVKAFATKPDDLNSIPGTYRIKEKKCLVQFVLWCPQVNTHKINLNKQKMDLASAKQTETRKRRGMVGREMWRQGGKSIS